MQLSFVVTVKLRCKSRGSDVSIPTDGQFTWLMYGVPIGGANAKGKKAHKGLQFPRDSSSQIVPETVWSPTERHKLGVA